MYQITNLKKEHQFLNKECSYILNKLNLSFADLVDVYFIYNKNVNNFVEVGLVDEEKFMYVIQCAKDEDYFTLKLPLDNVNYQYCYIILYFEDYCIIARYGYREGEEEESARLYLLNNKDKYYLKDISSIKNNRVAELVSSKFYQKNIID